MIYLDLVTEIRPRSMSLLLIVWGWIGDKTKLVCYLIKSNERECLFVASLNERKKPRVFKSPHAEFKCF